MRTTILSIFHSATKPFSPFSLIEEQFLLYLLSQKPEDQLDTDIWRRANVDWAALNEARFLLTYLRDLPKVTDLSDDYSKLCHQSEAAFKRNLILNHLRLKLIERIAGTLSQQGIKCVFMKGAAELIRAQSSQSYKGRRAMDDIDFLCSDNDFESADKALLSMGFEYALDNFGDKNPLQVKKANAVEHAAQLIYRIKSGGVLLEVELHRNVSVGNKLKGYPPDFAKTLVESATPSDLFGTSVLAPSLESMLVQMVAHAASAINHYFLVWQENPAYKPFIDKSAKPTDRFLQMQYRIDLYQIDFLFKLKNFLDEFSPQLARSRIDQLVTSTKDRRILDYYLYTAQELLPQYDIFDCLSTGSESLTERRRRLVLRELLRSNKVTSAVKRPLTLFKRLLS